MKTIFTFLKNWFSKNGLLKIAISFLLLIISAVIVNNTDYSQVVSKIFTWVGIISLVYIILTILIFFISGIINSLKKP